jgi:hypothetical protein
MEIVSLSKNSPEKRRNPWFWNAMITAAVVVGMTGLSSASPSVAWGIAAFGLAALVVFFYLAGRSER